MASGKARLQRVMDGGLSAVVFPLAGMLLLALPSAAEARRKPGVELVTAMVRVLDPAGAPVTGVEVEMLITRADGSEDRRRGTTSADGSASFDDVRPDCLEFQASALLETGRVDGKARSCSDGLDAFVVLPGTGKAAAPPAAITVSPYPEEAPAVVPLEPEPPAEPKPPAPEPPAEPKPPAPAPAAAGPAPVPAAPAGESDAAPGEEKGRLTIGGEVGVGFCQAWFYRPGPDDPHCGEDNVSLAFDVEVDGGAHVTEWLVLGVRLGYGYFESTARFPVEDEEDPGEQIDPEGVVAAGEGRVDGAGNHRLRWGLGARAMWAGRWLVAGADLVPLALLHHFTRAEGRGIDSFTEFVVSAGIFAGLRVDRSWWLGVQARFLQPLPWIDDRRFLPGALVLGVAFGWRSDRNERPAAGPADPEPAEAADPDLERRKRFIETQQDRGGF